MGNKYCFYISDCFMNNKYYCCLVVAIIFAFPTSRLDAQTEERIVYYENKELGNPPKSVRFRYQLKDGKMSGAYYSYYRNGRLRAIGTLENGCFAGEWKVFHPDGKLAVKRFYHGVAVYETICPPLPKKGPAALFGQPAANLPHRDSSGLFQYRAVREADIWWEKRLFRWLPASQHNKRIFENDRIWRILWPSVSDGTLPVYQLGKKDGRFTKRIPFDSVASFNTDSLRLIGLEMKEIWFFDKSILTMDVRIIGISPVFQHEVSGDTVRPFWIYYPSARPVLAMAGAMPDWADKRLNHLEDVFYYRDFNSIIYKIDNAFDNTPNEFYYRENMESKYELIDLEMIEGEIERWQYFKKQTASKKD